MPELPEVETIKRRLSQILPGKTITAVDVYAQRSFLGLPSQLVGKTITSVTRRAKILSIAFEESESDTNQSQTFLLTHLKMTGQLIYVAGDKRVGGGHPTADWTQTLPSNHTRISYQFDDETMLHFNDMRLFGWMKVLDKHQVNEHFSQLGPDINDPTISAEYLYTQLQRRTVPIKQVLMDTKVVCGIGNIYACDALNLARISPFRPANTLIFADVEIVLQASQEVIEKGVALQGTTFDGKYVTVDGMAGKYQDEALAYGREGQPCFNCGSTIVKQKLGGRGTYYCEVCQR